MAQMSPPDGLPPSNGWRRARMPAGWKQGISAAVVMLFGLLICGCAGPGVKSASTPSVDRVAMPPQPAAVLFASNRDTGSRRAELYAMNADGSGQTRVTYSGRHHFIAGSDTTGRYLAASIAEEDTDSPAGLGDEDRRSLHLIDLSDGSARRLTDPEDNAEGDSFSPDGEWIVFMMTLKGERQSDLYKIRRNGSELTRLTDTKTAIEGDPEFSPDGSEIAYTYADGQTQRSQIRLMRADGARTTTIYDGGPGPQIGPFPPGNFDPSWSPDGQWLTFERAVEAGGNFGSGKWHIFRVRKDGTGITDLSAAGNHADAAEYLPSYSKDGKKILYGSIRQTPNPLDSHSDVFTMDADGNNQTRLTESPASDMYPAWL